MHLRIFLQQMKRSKKRTLLYVMLLMAVTAFFVMSANLYQNSVTNLKEVEKTYSTVAVMELYGEVDQYGQLVEPYTEKHVGYKSVSVTGYDLSSIVNADGVTDWDLRSKYGAYIEGNPSLRSEGSLMADQDIIRVKLIGNEPVELPVTWDYSDNEQFELKLQVLDSAAGCLNYGTTFRFDAIHVAESDEYREQIRRVNRSEESDKVILYPDVEYVITTWQNDSWMWGEEAGTLDVKIERGIELPIRLYPQNLEYGIKYWVNYSGSGESLNFSSGAKAGQPFSIQRWEDVQADPELKAYFEEAWKAVEIQVHTFTVELTNDISGIPVYHLGGANLKEGRMITAEEYARGAKVCMVSDKMAEYQRWTIGDKLNMKLYEADAMANQNDELGMNQPVWNKGTEDFFDSGEYEIVGIYTQNPITGNSGISRGTLAMPWYSIFIPEKSVTEPRTVEEMPVHGSLLSIRLKNGSINQFLEQMEELGLTEEQVGRYNPIFTFYDQGYSLIQPGLEAMSNTAKLLLTLSSVLLLVTCILLAFFFGQNQKQSVGIFRMLGGSKNQAVAAVLLCAMIMTILGAALGMLLGYHLAQSVGEQIVEENLATSEETVKYQAYVLPSEDTQEQALSVQVSPQMTLLSGGMTLMFPVLVLLFVFRYIHKEPRALLPKGEA